MKTIKRLYKREIYETKIDWLNKRGFGGSSASAIVGCNPFMSKIELYRMTLFSKAKVHEEHTAQMDYGIQLEPIIRNVFAIDFKDKYEVIAPKNYEMFRSIKKPYLTATIDGTLIDKKTKEKYVLEIKTHDIRSRSDDLNNWTNSIPQNYFIQVCHYLMILNDYVGAVLVAKLRFFGINNELVRTETRYYTISRKDESVRKSIHNLEIAETDFYENYVAKKVMPSIQIKLGGN